MQVSSGRPILGSIGFILIYGRVLLNLIRHKRGQDSRLKQASRISISRIKACSARRVVGEKQRMRTSIVRIQSLEVQE